MTKRPIIGQTAAATGCAGGSGPEALGGVVEGFLDGSSAVQVGEDVFGSGGAEQHEPGCAKSVGGVSEVAVAEQSAFPREVPERPPPGPKRELPGDRLVHGANVGARERETDPGTAVNDEGEELGALGEQRLPQCRAGQAASQRTDAVAVRG